MSLEKQFSPQQRVVVCHEENNDPTNTIGYYGTVIQILAEAKLQFPSQPLLWQYRVFIPFLDRVITVPGRLLVSTGILGHTIENLDWQICFDTTPAVDNSEIHGSYRIPGSGTTYFKFRKTEAKVATYQLAVQITTALPDARLIFDVPRTTQLTPTYVRAAIRRILGFPDDEELTGIVTED